MRMRFPINIDHRDFEYSLSQTLPALSKPQKYLIQTDTRSWFVCLGLVGTQAQAYTLNLLRNASGFMNEAIYNVAIVGTRLLPYWFPAPIIIKPGDTFTAELTNMVPAGVNAVTMGLLGVRMADSPEASMTGRRIGKDKIAAFPRELYIYAQTVTLTAGQSMPRTIITDTRGEFVTEHLQAVSTGGFMSRITDGSSGGVGNWDDNYIPNLNRFGNAQYPAKIHPTVIRPGGSLTTAITDTSNAPNTIQTAFVGYIR